MIFEELDKSEIFDKYNLSFHDRYYIRGFSPENIRYFNIKKYNRDLCFYVLINYTDKICEAFWLINSFNGKVFTKEFFGELFKHAFSLGYKEIYAWSKDPKFIKLFNRFRNFGIEMSGNPIWDMDDTKTWFIKRI